MRVRAGVPEPHRPSDRCILAIVASLAVAACGMTPTGSPAASGSPGPSLRSAAPAGPSLAIAWESFAIPVDLADAEIDGIDGGPAGGLLLVNRTIQEPDLDEVTRTAVLAPDLLGFHVVADPAPFVWPVLVALPDRYLALEPAPPDEGPAPVWSSTDGARWDRLAGTGMIRNPMTAVAAGGNVVACGQAPEEMGCVVSADAGNTWRRAESDVPVRWGDEVSSRGSAFVGLGWDAAGLPRVLESRNGAAWSVLAADPLIAGLSGQWALDMGSVGSTVTIRGTEPDGRQSGEPRGVIVASPDLRTWTRLALPVSTAMSYDLVPFAGGLLAFGIRLENQSFGIVSVLVSSDGLSWADAHVPAALEAADTRVAVVGRRIIVLARTVDQVTTITGRIIEVADPDRSPPPHEPLPTPVPEPSGVPRPLAWEVAGTFDGFPSAAASNGDRLVIVGTDATDGSAAAWWLRDGRAWTRAPAPEAGASASMEAVVAWGDGFVATGIDWAADRGTATAAFWWSDDGSRWSRAPARPEHDLGLPGEDAVVDVTDVAAGPHGLVAVGSTSRGGVVFASADGRDWRLVADLDGDPAAIIRTADGFLAVGQSGNAHYPGAGMTWTSAEGTTWSEGAALDGGPLNGAASAQLGGAPGYAIVGTGPAAWTSHDGITWTWAPDQATLTDGSMRAVTAEPDGLTAAGDDHCRPGTDCVVAWRSADGRAWSRVALPLAAAGDTVVATVWHDGRAWVVACGEQRGANAMAGTIVWVGRPD